MVLVGDQGKRPYSCDLFHSMVSFVLIKYYFPFVAYNSSVKQHGSKERVGYENALLVFCNNSWTCLEFCNANALWLINEFHFLHHFLHFVTQKLFGIVYFAIRRAALHLE